MSKSLMFCNNFACGAIAPQAKLRRRGEIFFKISQPERAGERNVEQKVLSKSHNSSISLKLSACVTCQILLHLLGAEIPLTSLDRILLTSHLAYLSEGVSDSISSV
jgi:hypothetical protein